MLNQDFEFVTEIVREHRMLCLFAYLSIGVHLLTLMGMGWLICKFERTKQNPQCQKWKGVG